MSQMDEERIASIWKLQSVPALALTPARVRERATAFERQLRQRAREDILACLGVVLCFVVAAAVSQGPILRVGLLLVAAWAAIGAYLLRRFGTPDRFPAEPSASTAWYIRHLERQRDYMLSAPWGMGLALPGLILVMIGYAMPPAVVSWQVAVALVGIILFVYFAFVIYGKLLAGRWQQEIDALRAMAVTQD